MAHKIKERPAFIGFYLPPDLQKWAADLAKSDKRSLSNYLVNLLESERANHVKKATKRG